MILLIILLFLKFIDVTSGLILTSSIITIVALKFLQKADKSSVLGVYRLPSHSYWLKCIFFFIILNTRKFAVAFKGKYFGTPKDCSLYEKPQKLSFHKKTVDAVYFNGSNKNGDYFIIGTARRKNGLVNGFIYLKCENSGVSLLELPKQPDTCLYQEKETNGYVVENIEIKPVEPMKMWKINFKGKMKKYSDPSETFDVEINATWRSELPFFNFDTDIDSLLMAKTVALEKWSRNYFKLIQKSHQTHYEQFGETECYVKINSENYFFKLDTIRDHTFGNNRNWCYFHRYALHFINLENGDRIFTGFICTPIVFSSLKVGYLYSKKDGKLYPITSSDFSLYQHGENGEPPADYAYSFEAGSDSYTVQVSVMDSAIFYLEEKQEAKIVEMQCKFNVNAKEGWGFSEFQYYNLSK